MHRYDRETMQRVAAQTTEFTYDQSTESSSLLNGVKTLHHFLCECQLSPGPGERAYAQTLPCLSVTYNTWALHADNISWMVTEPATPSIPLLVIDTFVLHIFKLQRCR